MTTCLCARVRVDDATSATVRVNDPPAVTFGSSEYVPYVPQMDEWRIEVWRVAKSDPDTDGWQLMQGFERVCDATDASDHTLG